MEKLGKILLRYSKRKSRKRECYDDNQLASFVEGELDTNEVPSMLAHLNSCERCDEIVTNVMRLEQQSNVLSFPKLIKYKPAAYSAITAVAACLMLVAYSLYTNFNQSQLPYNMNNLMTDWALNSELNDISQEDQLSTQITMSYGFDSKMPIERATFNIGLLSTSLRFAVLAKDLNKTQHLLGAYSAILKAITMDNSFNDDMVEFQNRSQVGKFPDLVEMETKLSRIIKQERTTFYYQFGVWVKASELAAKTGNPSFFDRPIVTYHIEQSKIYKLPPGVIHILGELLILSENGFNRIEDYVQANKGCLDIMEILR
jgi:hypothetical protein